MKTIYKKITAFVLFLLCNNIIIAQNISDIYMNVGWQFNSLTNSNIVDKSLSLNGAYIDGGVRITKHFSVGAFVNYQYSEDYIPRQTFIMGNSALTIDQIHSVYQVPFGVSGRFHITEGQIDPYVGIKLGTEFSRADSYFNQWCARNDSWGFYMSPEIGVMLYPTYRKNVGFHISAYYTFATNDNTILFYPSKSLNNIGFRLGLAF